MIENAVFPGRFQPMTRSHIDIVKFVINDFQLNNLVVAIPVSPISRCNPFSAEQSLKIARLSLDEAGLNNVRTTTVDVSSGLYTTWRNYLKENKIDAVFTGNSRMSLLVNICAKTLGLNTKGVCFGDNSIGTIRATQVRRKLLNGENDWKGMVMPSAAEYILGLNIDYYSMPLSRNKRSWNYSATA